MMMEGHNGDIVKFNALLDTASHQSYINKDVKSKLNLNVINKVQYDMRTFIGSGVKKLEETSVKVFFTFRSSSRQASHQARDPF